MLCLFMTVCQCCTEEPIRKQEIYQRSSLDKTYGNNLFFSAASDIIIYRDSSLDDVENINYCQTDQYANFWNYRCQISKK